MKHLKAKLLTSVVMLLVAAVMMSTASYAWFTLSTNPEMKGIDTQIVVNENLEIALCAQGTEINADSVPGASLANDSKETTNPARTWQFSAYTWGNLVDFTDDAITAYLNVNKNMRPATLSGADDDGTTGNFYYPVYGTDGRVKTVDGAIIDPDDLYGINVLKDANGLVYGYFIDFWMRSNMAGTVTLGAAAARSSGTSAATGAGSTFIANGETIPDLVLAKNVRVAFKALYEATPGTTLDTINTYSVAAYAGAANTVATAMTTSASGKTNTFTGNVVTLKANCPVLVRAYFYLEGKDVTNAAASTDETTVKGTFNLQFTMTGVDHSMDKVDT